jgi:acyl-CoA synthetase (AMP-forming)/AMP-acid ligase II
MINGMITELSGVEHVIGVYEGHGLNLDFETMIRENPADDAFWPVSPEDLFMTIYTSGTTGNPKGAMLTHANLTAASLCEGYEYRLVPSDICMTCVPLFFIGGWGSTCIPFLLRGCTQHILSFDPEAVLRQIHEEKVSCVIMVPTIINILCNHPDVNKYDYSSLRAIPFAGSALPVEHWRRAEEVFGKVMFSAYGFTEGCGTVCLLQPEDVDTGGDEKAVQRLASCGKAMAQTAMKLIDEKGKDIPLGSEEVGEILVKGPTILKGYWKQPEATEEALKNNWFHTGDLARRDEDGFYYIVDRKKDMIITGDINVYPREIEEVIYTHPAVMDCSVIGVPDPKWGETIKAVITLKEGMTTSPDEIIRLCTKNLAPFKKPTSVDIVDDMPRTASGKILKRELRDLYWKDRKKKI